MPFTKGNKISVGNKGGGRKSAYQETADAQLLWDMFNGKLSQKKIEKLMSKGRYSLKDKFVGMAFKGNERILVEIFKKLFPDKVENDFKRPIHISVTRGGEDRKESGSVQGSSDTLASDDTTGVEK